MYYLWLLNNCITTPAVSITDCEEAKYQFTQLRLGQLIQSLNANDSLSDVKSIYEEPGAGVDAYISGL